jgi:hypothetical protein
VGGVIDHAPGDGNGGIGGGEGGGGTVGGVVCRGSIAPPSSSTIRLLGFLGRLGRRLGRPL